MQKIDVISLRHRVGMLFQKPNPFPLSIIRNIEFPLREHGVKSREKIDEVVEDALRDVGLWDEVKDRLKSPALALCGGQQLPTSLAEEVNGADARLVRDSPATRQIRQSGKTSAPMR